MDSFDLEMQRDKFLRIFDEQIGEREGKDALRDWLLSDDCDFFIAPASTKYHGGYAGGLCQHSIDVYQYAKKLSFLIPTAPTEESWLRVHETTALLLSVIHRFDCVEAGRSRVLSPTGRPAC